MFEEEVGVVTVLGGVEVGYTAEISNRLAWE